MEFFLKRYLAKWEVHWKKCTKYYPFGLTMAGISSKAANRLDNKRKFNGGTELNTDLDLNTYETPYRGYDPQTGRFSQIDPLAEAFADWTPYNYALNNPILCNDPTGLTAGFANDSLGRANILPNVTVRPSVKRMNYMQMDAFYARNTHWVNGQRVLGNISNFDAQSQKFLKDRNAIQIRQDAFDKVYGSVVQEIAITALPWGRVMKGISWAYKAAKGSQILSQLGRRGLEELSKEVLANRGNLREIDLFDVATNTLLGGKGGLLGKIGVEGLNALSDVSWNEGVQTIVWGSSSTKNASKVGLDLIFSGMQIFTGVAVQGVGMGTNGSNAYDVMFDQAKKTISDAAGQ